MEAHILIQPASDQATSYCFLPGEHSTDVGDFVEPGTHGTRVAVPCVSGRLAGQNLGGSLEKPPLRIGLHRDAVLRFAVTRAETHCSAKPTCRAEICERRTKLSVCLTSRQNCNEPCSTQFTRKGTNDHFRLQHFPV